MQAIKSDLTGLRWERNALKDLGVAQKTELKEEPELPFLGWAEIGEAPGVPPFTQSCGSAPEAPGLGQVDQCPVAHYGRANPKTVLP